MHQSRPSWPFVFGLGVLIKEHSRTILLLSHIDGRACRRFHPHMSDLIVSYLGYLKITTRACAAAFPFRYIDLYILPGCRYAICIHTYRTPMSTNQNRNQMILGLAYLPEQSVTSTTLRLLYQHGFIMRMRSL